MPGSRIFSVTFALLLCTGPALAQQAREPVGPQQDPETGEWVIRFFYSGEEFSRGDTLVKAIHMANKRGQSFNVRETKDFPYLREAKLDGANLTGVDLSGASMFWAHLRGSILNVANLTRTGLYGADLRGAELFRTNLTRAGLIDADLSGARLVKTNLTGARLSGADLSGAIFEPELNPVVDENEPRIARPQEFVDIASIAYARGLTSLNYETNSAAIYKLRAAFKENGYRRAEREVTYAIERQRYRVEKMSNIEAKVRYVLFDLSCQYGASPWRPFFIIMGDIFVFGLIYAVLLNRTKRGRKSFLWVTKNPDALEPLNARVRATSPLKRRRWLRSSFRLYRIALYFSLLSAFNIGFRDLNVGRWVSRVQFRNYSLGGRGWVRTLSGIQALLSVYLLGLWILTYFGRPFE